MGSFLAGLKQFFSDPPDEALPPPPPTDGPIMPMEDIVINIAKLTTRPEINAALAKLASEANTAAITVLRNLNYNFGAALQKLAGENDARGVETILKSGDPDQQSINDAFIEASDKNNTNIMRIIDNSKRWFGGDAARSAALAAAKSGATEAMAFVAGKIARQWDEGINGTPPKVDLWSFNMLNEAFRTAAQANHPETASAVLRILNTHQRPEPEQPVRFRGGRQLIAA